jgi:hypothetical protein
MPQSSISRRGGTRGVPVRGWGSASAGGPAAQSRPSDRTSARSAYAAARPRSGSTTTTAAPTHERLARRSGPAQLPSEAEHLQPIERIRNDAIVDCAVCWMSVPVRSPAVQVLTRARAGKHGNEPCLDIIATGHRRLARQERPPHASVPHSFGRDPRSPAGSCWRFSAVRVGPEHRRRVHPRRCRRRAGSRVSGSRGWWARWGVLRGGCRTCRSAGGLWPGRRGSERVEHSPDGAAS